MNQTNEQKCDGCGKSPAIHVQNRDETLCVSCIQMYATSDTLEMEMDTTLKASLQHWQQSGMSVNDFVLSLETFAERHALV